MFKVVVQKWVESERKWGVKPNGFSLHLTKKHLKAFIKEYWATMPNEVPTEYSRPHGQPYEAEVDDETLARIKRSVNGIREYGPPPGSGGTDGWIPMR